MHNVLHFRLHQGKDNTFPYPLNRQAELQWETLKPFSETW